MEKGVAHSTSSTGAEIPNPEGRTEKTIKNYQVHHEIVKLLKIKNEESKNMNVIKTILLIIYSIILNRSCYPYAKMTHLKTTFTNYHTI